MQSMEQQSSTQCRQMQLCACLCCLSRGPHSREVHQVVESLTALPRYAHDLVWDTDDGEEHSCTPSASAMESAAPLLSVPRNKASDLHTLCTIALQPDLFKVIMPVNVEKFLKLLETHPNRPFVNLVCQGFCHGFWPYTNTSDPIYLMIWDNSTHPIRDLADTAFLNEQYDKEVLLGHWSPAFGDTLLPGMLS